MRGVTRYYWAGARSFTGQNCTQPGPVPYKHRHIHPVTNRLWNGMEQEKEKEHTPVSFPYRKDWVETKNRLSTVGLWPEILPGPDHD